MNRVAIVDYGMGNLRSVVNAIREVGAQVAIVDKPDDLRGFSHVILPGVGAFAQAIANLEASGMRDAVDRERRAGCPILGICLGMQLMCRTSEEDGLHTGLGWIDGAVRRFPVVGLKVPHMGWDDLSIRAAHPLVAGVSDHSDFYFVHSYYVDCAQQSDIVLQGEYAVPYCAMFARENVAGAQFHPEKSQHAGLRLLKNFVAWSAC
jgi:imidazole glycerol-phosphate synthase subunit HisH